MCVCGSQDIKLLFFHHTIDFIYNLYDFPLFLFPLLQFLNQVFHDVTITLLSLNPHTVINRLWELEILPTGEVCLRQHLSGCVPRRLQPSSGSRLTRGSWTVGSWVFIPQSSVLTEASMRPLVSIQAPAHANLLGPFGPVIVCVGVCREPAYCILSEDL